VGCLEDMLKKTGLAGDTEMQEGDLVTRNGADGALMTDTGYDKRFGEARLEL
jgi:hypothetical protein